MMGDNSSPPAYSEQAFVQKVSAPLQAFSRVSQPIRASAAQEWEEWDEAAFEAAARATSGHGRTANANSGYGGSSSVRALPSRPLEKGTTEPLRIHKKSESISSLTGDLHPKPRPSWLSETGISDSGFHGKHSSSKVPAGPVHHNIPLDNDEDHSVPPPPFAAAGLDRPVYDQVNVRGYRGNESRPSSPLTSPRPGHLSLPDPRYTSSSLYLQPQRAHMQTYPTDISNTHDTPRQLPAIHSDHRVGQRVVPSSALKMADSSTMPRTDLRHSIAYNTRGALADFSAPQQMSAVDAKAFYNSSVSSLVPLRSPRSQRPHSYQPQNIHNQLSQPERQRTSLPANQSTWPQQYHGSMPPVIPSHVSNVSQYPSHSRRPGIG